MCQVLFTALCKDNGNIEFTKCTLISPVSFQQMLTFSIENKCLLNWFNHTKWNIYSEGPMRILIHISWSLYWDSIKQHCIDFTLQIVVKLHVKLVSCFLQRDFLWCFVQNCSVLSLMQFSAGKLIPNPFVISPEGSTEQRCCFLWHLFIIIHLFGTSFYPNWMWLWLGSPFYFHDPPSSLNIIDW